MRKSEIVIQDSLVDVEADKVEGRSGRIFVQVGHAEVSAGDSFDEGSSSTKAGGQRHKTHPLEGNAEEPGIHKEHGHQDPALPDL